MPNLVSLVIVGAGQRGKVYSSYALERPDLCQVVAVCEPREYTRKLMQKRFKLSDSQVFKDWREIADKPKLADAVVIATQDRDHQGPAVAFANKAYAILLEKPMSISEEECRTIIEAVQRNNVLFAVGHVLRYTPFSEKIKELVSSGALGEVVNIERLEPVGFFHFAHSYVRGNWRKEEETHSSLMAKCCHDLDWINWVAGNRKCKRVSSFGSLKHFKAANKPEGAASNCMNCPVEESCCYSAKKIYLEPVEAGARGWPASVLVEDVTVPNIEDALVHGPYGRCVYDCDNNVVDNQVVLLEYEDGLTASLTMIAFSEKICKRQTRIFGTRGELVCDEDAGSIRHFDFLSQTSKLYTPKVAVQTELSGHCYADYYLMSSFIKAVQTGDPSWIKTGPQETLNSHLLVFKAEHARRQGIVVNFEC